MAIWVFGTKVNRFESIAPLRVEVSNSSLKVKPSSGKRHGSQGSHHLPSLKDLGVFSRSGLTGFRNLKEGRAGVSVGSDEPDSPYRFQNQLTTRTFPALSYLFHRIDGSFAYPQDLKNARISGEVTAKLSFNEHGKWVDSAFEIKGNSFLRVYLIHRLRECLSDGLPENIWKAYPHAISVDAQFIFDIVAPERVTGAQAGPQFAPSANPSKFNTVDTDGGQSVEKQLISTKQGIYGSRFQFYRVYLSSPLEWKFGPLSGYGIAPTVGIDPSWVVDKVGDFFHPKVKIDPLEHYRDDPDW
jgi:hypothetical protein